MARQQEYAERNSTERDNTLTCSLKMPGEHVWKGCRGSLEEQNLLDPWSACHSAGVSSAARECRSRRQLENRATGAQPCDRASPKCPTELWADNSSHRPPFHVGKAASVG